MIETAKKLLEVCKQKKIKIALAESCTGGMVASIITSISGSSEVFDRGFITYSNESKVEILGVPQEVIIEKGAVSHEVAEHMVIGAKSRSMADIAIAITGIAGPTGGTETKPVGLVYIAVKYRGNTEVIENHFQGDREDVRTQATIQALNVLYKKLLS